MANDRANALRERLASHGTVPFSLTLLLALTVGIGPLSINIILPSLPTIATEFEVSPSGAQATISAFLFAFAVGQLAVGPISDRIGRRPVLIAGLVAFFVANALCVFVSDITTLIVLRVIQGLVATAPVVLARSVVRDLFTGAAAARQLALMGSVTGLVPVLSPILGGAVETVAGWRMDFAIMAALALVNLAAVFVLLSETLRQRLDEPFSPVHLARGYGLILRSPTFRLYGAIVVTTFSALFSVISGMPFVLRDEYGLSPFVFGITFGLAPIAYVCGSFLSYRFVARLGIDRLLSIGVSLLALGGAGLTVGLMIGSGNIFEVMAPTTLFMLGIGFTMPQAMAGALMPFPERAASAAALMGFFQMTGGAITGAIIGLHVGDSPTFLGVAVLTLGLGSLALFTFYRKGRLGTGGS